MSVPAPVLAPNRKKNATSGKAPRALGVQPTTRPALLALLALLGGCALFGSRPSQHATGVSSARHVFLRNSFDMDPSNYVGRFVPRGRSDLDETAAMQLTCSQHIGYQFVEGGGVEYTETMAVSTDVAAKIGVPLVASGSASASNETTVKVQYKLTGKMVGRIDDPEAFARCCKESPDQCTDRYIGEFLQGTGSVYQSSTMNLAAGGRGRSPQGVEGEASASHDESVDRVVTFEQPVYFAFKLTETPYTRATSACGSWVDTPPTQEGFVYFVGSSRPVRAEGMARTAAEQKAKQKAAQAVMKIPQVAPDGEAGDAAPAPLPMDTKAMEWAKSMEIVESCVETETSARGTKYVGRVLGKLPEYDPGE